MRDERAVVVREAVDVGDVDAVGDGEAPRRAVGE
jgi:hypothetical protein